MSEKLKPCHDCASDALGFLSIVGKRLRPYWIICDDCGRESAEQFWTKRDAITDWNTNRPVNRRTKPKKKSKERCADCSLPRKHRHCPECGSRDHAANECGNMG